MVLILILAFRTYRAPTTTCCLATSNSSWEYDVTPSCWNRLVFAKSETIDEERKDEFKYIYIFDNEAR